MKLTHAFWLPLQVALAHTPNDTFEETCSSLLPRLSITNAVPYTSSFVPSGTNLSLPDNNATCNAPYQIVPVDLCRITLYVSTSNHSGINMEAWLPLNWTGRFLSVGNGGLAGCIGYADLAYGASLGFASVGANNGHNGTSGGAFFNNGEVVKDFAYRSIHTGVIVGKQITSTFYNAPHTKSYYLGCSTGGRQGFKSAQDFPEDFDGIVAGAPAFAFNNLSSWSGHFFPLTGTNSSERFVPLDMWSVIHQDVLRQCDMLDNYADGILEDPSLCNYTSAALLCGSPSANSNACLTPAQASTVDAIFQPLRTSDGSLVYPRMQPGAEDVAPFVLYTGTPFPYAVEWFRYAVYNDSSWDPAGLNSTDYENAARINPGGIQTWSGDLSAVRDRGAKILHYHGLADGLISSDISPWYYEHVASSMRLNSSALDEFYRFFRISGAGHCAGGPGASVIGQGLGSVQSLEPERNVLMAVVEWVENGRAPDTVVGTRWVNGTKEAGVEYERAHCRYPTRNVYRQGDPKAIESWECVL